MKIIQINTVAEYSSTGRTTIELANILDEKGFTSYIAYGQKKTNYKRSFKIGTRLENHIHNAFSRLLGNQGYYTRKGTKKFISYLEEIKPDVIHLRNLHGNYLNLKLFFEYLQKLTIPIVWTIHDCWAYTGKCSHYTEVKCYKWQTSCQSCIQLDKYPKSLFFDQSKKNYLDKKRWILSLNNLTVVSVSKWLSNELKKSYFSNRKILNIYNWIDHNIFFPRNQSKSNYKIDNNDFIILCVSAKWETHDTKFQDLIELSKRIDNKTQIILVGNILGTVDLPNNINHISYVSNTEELANIYSVSDVYIHFSLEDTFGKVIAEALSCGTPAIVYDSTACPELIAEGCGFIVKPHDIDAIISSVNFIKNKGTKHFKESCIKNSKENFSIDKNANKYINLYNSLII